MTRRKFLITAMVALTVLAVGGTAQAIKLRAGDIIIYAEGGFTPTKLPRNENAPITIHGGGRIDTVSGELPPILETIDIEYDRHGSVETTGLPVCRQGQLEATTVDQARASAGPRSSARDAAPRSSSSPNRRRFPLPLRSRSSTGRKRTATTRSSPMPS